MTFDAGHLYQSHSYLDYDTKSVMIGINLEGLKSFFHLGV